MNEPWRSRITVEAGKRGGQRSCIRGMRISVYDVLHLAAGMSVDEILDDLPYLTAGDQASLAYAAERERSMLVAVA